MTKPLQGAGPVLQKAGLSRRGIAGLKQHPGEI